MNIILEYIKESVPLKKTYYYCCQWCEKKYLKYSEIVILQYEQKKILSFYPQNKSDGKDNSYAAAAAAAFDSIFVQMHP